MMKKLTSLLLSVVMLVSLLACGASAKTLSAKTLRIAGLKGPTTMGLVNLLSMEKNGTAAMDYDLQLYGAADEIVPKLIKGNLDMAAIPANLAATLYQKTNGGIQVLAVNWVSQTLFHSLVRSRTTRSSLSFIWAAVT